MWYSTGALISQFSFKNNKKDEKLRLCFHGDVFDLGSSQYLLGVKTGWSWAQVGIKTGKVFLK
jgi:hypothetical protein